MKGIGINCECGWEYDVFSNDSEYVSCPRCQMRHWIGRGIELRRQQHSGSTVSSLYQSNLITKLAHSWSTEWVGGDDNSGVRYASEWISMMFDQETKLYQVEFCAADANWGRHWMSGAFSGLQREKQSTGDFKKALHYYLTLAERYAPLGILPDIRRQIKVERMRTK